MSQFTTVHAGPHQSPYQTYFNFDHSIDLHFYIYHVKMMNFILNPELQLVLDDSERIRNSLRDFRSVLAEISAVCDVSKEEERLEQNDQQVHKMQRNILEPLKQLLQAVEVGL